MRTAVRRCYLLILGLLLSACVSAPQTMQLTQQVPAVLDSPINLDHVPFFPQEDYQCGPAALATVLGNTAINVIPDELVSQVYIPARRGSLQIEMLATARRYGRVPYVLSGSLAEMLEEVGNGRPVLVMQNLGLNRLPQWHYAVVVGYDLSRREIRLRSGTIRDYVISLSLFEKTWARADHWAVVVLEPGQLPQYADETAYFQQVADFEISNAGDSVLLAWQAGLERWPGSRLMSMGLSNQLYAQGQTPAAAEVLQDLLKSDSNFAAAHNNLAWLLSQLGNVDAAITHARQAVQLAPDNEAFQATLAALQSNISSGK